MNTPSSTSSSFSSTPSSTPSSITIGGRSRRRRGGAFTTSSPSSSTSSVPSTVAMGGRRRKRRGGSGEGAAPWVIKNFGATAMDQFNNTFGPGTANNGNLIPTIPGAPAVGPNNVPQGSLDVSINRAPIQNGGRSRRKKGGYWGQVINQALVPFGLLGLQNMFSRRRSHKK